MDGWISYGLAIPNVPTQSQLDRRGSAGPASTSRY